MCAVLCAAFPTAASANMLYSDSTKETTRVVVTAPDCLYVSGARMVRIAPYMRFVFGVSPVWDAETKTIDFYYTNQNGRTGHMRVKTGASYVSYSGTFANEYLARTGQSKTEAFSKVPNQVINGSVYVDELALRDFVLYDTDLKP